MSISLVKKSLELATGRAEDRSINFRGYPKSGSKERKLSKKRTVDDKNKKDATIAVKKIRDKTVIDSTIDKVERNVERLLNLSCSNTIHNKLEKKLLVENRRKQEFNKTHEEKTGFTEEDFTNFEREYFANQ